MIKVYKSCIQYIEYQNIFARERELEVGLTSWSLTGVTVAVWQPAVCEETSHLKLL